MMSHELFHMLFNMHVFANYPKCIGAFDSLGQTEDGTIIKLGCLLTAFYAAFGIETSDASWMRETFDRLVETLGLPWKQYRTSLQTSPVDPNMWLDHVNTPSYSLTYNYDHDTPEIALNFIWEVIEALPNKVNHTTKESVTMPELCKV